MHRFVGYILIWIVSFTVSAQWQLARSDDVGAPKPTGSSPDEIRRLIRQLSDDRFSVREIATKRLKLLGQQPRKALRQVANDPDAELEARQRAESVLRLLAGSITNDLQVQIAPVRDTFDINEPLAFLFRIRNVSAQPIRLFNPALAGDFANDVEFRRSGRFALVNSDWPTDVWELNCVRKFAKRSINSDRPITLKPGQECSKTLICTAPLYFRPNARRGYIQHGRYFFETELHWIAEPKGKGDCHLGIVKARTQPFRIGNQAAEAKRNELRHASKPVRAGDLSIELLAPDLVPAVARGHQHHFDMGLRICNHGKKDLWFVQNEMKLSITAANGRPVPGGLNRDSLRDYPPVHIAAGAKRVVNFPGTFVTRENGVHAVRIADKTGGFWCFEPLHTGNYTLGLRYQNKSDKIDAKWAESINKRFGKRIPAGAPLWVGRIATEPIRVCVTATPKDKSE